MRAVQVEQRTTSSALPNQRTHPVAYLLAGGLIAGTLDILYAYTFWAVKSQIPAQRIFQDVAAGLVGEASFQGGWSTAALGLALHFLIAITTAAVYYLVALRWPLFWGQPCSPARSTACWCTDGYSAVRSYSIASAPNFERRVQLTVEQLPDGEVSPYLTQVLAVGGRLEVRGPIGGWFVWRPEQKEPIQLIAGGSGLVPLMAMIRSRAAAGSTAPFRLLYSVREPGAVLYRDELQALSDHEDSVSLTYAYTRAAPKDWPQPPGRIDAVLIAQTTWPSNLFPTCYVCGPTSWLPYRLRQRL